MTVKVIMNAKAKAGTGNEVAEYLKSRMPTTRTYDGCLSAVSYQGVDDTDDVMTLETWESREHHKKYISRRRGEGDTARHKGMFDGEPRYGYVEEVEI